MHTLRKVLHLSLIILPLFFASSLQAQDSPEDLTLTYKNLELFSNILSIVQQNYVDEIDAREAIEGAIKGLLISLDPHSTYLKPDDFKELQVETKGSFSGIGIEITIKDDLLTVVSPIEDTPAFRAGIEAGDRIIKIEGEATKEMSLFEAVKKLRGKKGSPVTISIHREGFPKLKDYIIIRDVIPIHSVRTNIIEPGYGYARVTNFQRNTSGDLQKKLQELLREGPLQGLVLDLRNNPGGLLDSSVKVADIFLDKGIIVSTKGRLPDQDMEFSAHSSGFQYDFPMVVLINGGTASASEIVAGALQDHKRALVLGTQSFGKGSVQTIIPMADGAGLRLTTARYYTPNGTSIQAKGIIPDAVVPKVPEPEESPKDPMQFLREKDLRFHLENVGDLQEAEEKPEPPTIQETDLISSRVDLADEIREKLEDDNQLIIALLVLKSMTLPAGENSAR